MRFAAAVVVVCSLGVWTARAQPVSEATREFQQAQHERHQREKQEAQEHRRRQERIFTMRELGKNVTDERTREEIIESIDPDARPDWDEFDEPAHHFFYWIGGLVVLALGIAGVLYRFTSQRSMVASDGATIPTPEVRAELRGMVDVSTIMIALRHDARSVFAHIEGDAFDRLRATVRALLGTKEAWLAAGTVEADPVPQARAQAQLQKTLGRLERALGDTRDAGGVFVVALSVVGKRDLGGYSGAPNPVQLENRLRYLAQVLPDELAAVDASVLPESGTVSLEFVCSEFGLSRLS